MSRKGNQTVENSSPNIVSSDTCKHGRVDVKTTILLLISSVSNDVLMIFFFFFFSIVAAAEFCKKLKSERVKMQNESEVLKLEIDSLNSDIR